jgi:hypothetical protein
MVRQTMSYKQKIYEMHRGAVTVLDVLGWRGIWERRNDAPATLQSLIYELIKEARGTDTEIKSISDTIVLFTREEDPAKALTLHARLCSKAVCSSIWKRIPLRGATSYGSYSFSENIMIGPAVDEAAYWHETTAWIGVMLTPSALLSTNMELPKGWCSYCPPFKDNSTWETGCVEWYKDWAVKKSELERTKSLSNIFYTMGPLVPGIAEYYMNTISFFNYFNDQREN